MLPHSRKQQEGMSNVHAYSVCGNGGVICTSALLLKGLQGYRGWLKPEPPADGPNYPGSSPSDIDCICLPPPRRELGPSCQVADFYGGCAGTRTLENLGQPCTIPETSSSSFPQSNIIIPQGPLDGDTKGLCEMLSFVGDCAKINGGRRFPTNIHHQYLWYGGSCSHSSYAGLLRSVDLRLLPILTNSKHHHGGGELFFLYNHHRIFKNSS